jgi:hypothetical protein
MWLLTLPKRCAAALSRSIEANRRPLGLSLVERMRFVVAPQA